MLKNANKGAVVKDTVDPKILFWHFARKYLVHDAKDSFPWAARFIKSGHVLLGSTRMAPRPYWIKSGCSWYLILIWNWCGDSFFCKSCGKNKASSGQITQQKVWLLSVHGLLRPISVSALVFPYSAEALLSQNSKPLAQGSSQQSCLWTGSARCWSIRGGNEEEEYRRSWRQQQQQQQQWQLRKRGWWWWVFLSQQRRGPLRGRNLSDKKV